MVLYQEELQWLQWMCRKESSKPQGSVQLGCLKGGRRTLICTRRKFGVDWKLELRLFAPFGKRQLCVPEVVVGMGWVFFADILETFVIRKVGTHSQKQEIQKSSGPSIKSMSSPHLDRRNRSTRVQETVHQKKTYLQAASLPSWGFSNSMSSYIDEKENSVIINYEEAVEKSFQMTRCLVGSLRGKVNEASDLDMIKGWIERRWKVPGGVEVRELSLDTFLFIFPSRELAEEKIGKALVNGYSLLLDRWHSWCWCWCFAIEEGGVNLPIGSE